MRQALLLLDHIEPIILCKAPMEPFYMHYLDIQLLLVVKTIGRLIGDYLTATTIDSIVSCLLVTIYLSFNNLIFVAIVL